MPAALLHAGVLWMRHMLYDVGVFSSQTGALPTIALGNLTVGGTGKTPHVLLLLEALEAIMGRGQVAILSRGYGRKTSGYREVYVGESAALTGDEPLMMKRKLPEVVVAVCEDRLTGLKRIAADHPEVRWVVLDDALQHRKLRPTLRLLLVDATQPMGKDMLIPAGRLRDLKSRAEAAEATLVSRLPSNTVVPLTAEHRQSLGISRVIPTFCSTMKMGRELHNLAPARTLVICAIAQPQRFTDAVTRASSHSVAITYPDHQAFTPLHVQEWKRQMQKDNLDILVTTEKDWVRMQDLEEHMSGLRVQPVSLEAKWLPNSDFHQWLQDAVEKKSQVWSANQGGL